MKIKLVYLLLIAMLASDLTRAQSVDRQSSYDFNKRLGRGINYMAVKINKNVHDPYDFKLVRENHFTHIRLGSRLWQHYGPGPDYTIDPIKLQEYKNAVDWALDAGLMVVVDPIHYWRDYTDSDLPILKKLWEQLAGIFADYPVDMVAFEIMNEPESYEIDLKKIIHESLAIIRSFPGNQNRQVIVAGQAFSTRQALIDAFKNNLVFPIDDPNLIGTFHYYDPRPFSKQGAASNIFWAEEGDNDADWNITETAFDEVIEANNNWAEINNTHPLPIYNGEYGIDNGAPAADRLRWLWWVKNVSEERGFSHAIWNLYGDEPTSKGMGPFTSLEENNPPQRRLHQEVMEPYRSRVEFENLMAGEGSIVASNDEASNAQVIRVTGDLTNSTLEVKDFYIARSGNFYLNIRFKKDYDTPAAVTAMVVNDNSEIYNKSYELPYSNNWVYGVIPIKLNALRSNLKLTIDRGSGYPIFDFITVTKSPYNEFMHPGEILLLNEIDAVLSSATELALDQSYFYPNPATDTISIVGQCNQWQIFTANGQLVKAGKSHTVDVSTFKPGIYVLILDEKKHKLFIY